MNIAIVGSRTFNNYDILDKFIYNTVNIEDIDLVISGGARGADALAERFAQAYGIEIKVFPAEWDKYGKSAGYRRNVDIINACDICFAFWDGQSRGTKHDLTLCKEKNKPCYVYDFVKNTSYKY